MVTLSTLSLLLLYANVQADSLAKAALFALSSSASQCMSVHKKMVLKEFSLSHIDIQSIFIVKRERSRKMEVKWHNPNDNHIENRRSIKTCNQLEDHKKKKKKLEDHNLRRDEMIIS